MIHTQRHKDLRFNMAPMIDVVFLLIIFFMLVSTFVTAENVRMELPNPDKSLAQNVKVVDRVVINCRISDTGTEQRALYSVGPNPVESLEKISERLSAAKQANPQLRVIIRADKRLRYEQVRTVMDMVADNQIENMSLVAHVGSQMEE